MVWSEKEEVDYQEGEGHGNDEYESKWESSDEKPSQVGATMRVCGKPRRSVQPGEFTGSLVGPSSQSTLQKAS